MVSKISLAWENVESYSNLVENLKYRNKSDAYKNFIFQQLTYVTGGGEFFVRLQKNLWTQHINE